MRPEQRGAEATAAPFLARDAFLAATQTVSSGDSGLHTFMRGRLDRSSDTTLPDVCLRGVWNRGTEVLLPAFARRARATLERLSAEEARPRVDRDEPGAEILAWRYACLRLPAGLWLAAACETGERPAGRVRLLATGAVPPGPLALHHLHANAALPFEAVFTHLMCRPRALSLKADDVPVGLDPTRWRRWIAAARAARRLLAHRLVTGERWPGTAEAAQRAALRRAVDGLLHPLTVDHWSEDIEHTLWRLTRARTVGRRGPIWARDPLYQGSPWPEGMLLSRIFHHVEHSLPDAEFARLALQYIRVKCILHEHLVHDPAINGLERFVDTYERAAAYADGLDETAGLNFAACEPELDLQSVECRTGPRSASAIGRLVLRTGECRLPTEVGWTFHVLRHRRPRGAAISRIQWARAHHEALRGLRIALALHPAILRFVRGIDIAAREQRGPLWLVAGAIRELRVLSRRAAARTTERPLCVTLHAGEDFPHLLTGLRAVDEGYVWGLLDQGDRIGHALALGLEVDTWLENHPRILTTRFDRYLDLSWCLSLLEKGWLELSATAIHALSAEHDRHRRDLWRTSAAGEMITHRSLGALRLLDVAAPLPPALKLYLSGDPDAERRFAEVIDVPAAGDRELLHASQRHCLVRVSRWDTVVELNPSSNLLVAGFRRPLEQPAFRLRPLGPDGPTTVRVSLSTDDPLQFATRLADELAYATAGLRAAGVDPGYVREWLAAAARTSWDARFTVPTSRGKRA